MVQSRAHGAVKVARRGRGLGVRKLHGRSAKDYRLPILPVSQVGAALDLEIHTARPIQPETEHAGVTAGQWFQTKGAEQIENDEALLGSGNENVFPGNRDAIR